MIPANVSSFHLNGHNHHDNKDDLVQVCYGGSFAATTEQVLLSPSSGQDEEEPPSSDADATTRLDSVFEFWNNIEQSLSRANNLEEGHFMERTWAALFTKPIPSYQQKAIREYSSHVMFRQSSFVGPLVRDTRKKESVPTVAKTILGVT